MKLNNFPKIKDRRLRVGLVGCGRISKNHFGSILHYPDDLELAAVCDIDNDTLNHAKSEFGVNGYSDFQVMLTNEELDLVVLYPEWVASKQAILAAKHARTCCIGKANGNQVLGWFENG